MCVYGTKHSDHQFKFHQHKLRAVLPNLTLAKVTHYTVL